MVRKLEFNGQGGALLKTFIVGMILTGITFGIYASWFQTSLTKYLYENTKLKGGAGDVRFEYTGTGGGLFVVMFVGMLLTGLTLGIYMPWFMCKMTAYAADNSVAHAADGTTYKLQFNGKGGDLFVTYLVGAILCGITLYIYMPWFMCKLQKFFRSNTAILKNGAKAGELDFVGQGGDLFVIYLVGMLLTGLTFGVYGAWFQVKMMRFMDSNLRATLDGTTYSGDFTGTGGELFVILLVGGLLTGLTLGIYGAWFFVKQMKFQYDHTTFTEVQAARALQPAA